MKPIQIAIGVLKKDNDVLISLRQKHQVYADYWEFPGGKVEESEGIIDALKREFIEELGLNTRHWKPLITIPWQYEHAHVQLNVFTTRDYDGELPSSDHAIGVEGQKILWVPQDTLDNYAFPEANEAIKLALSLPDSYMISGHFDSIQDGLSRLERALKKGIRFVQLRAKKMPDDDFVDFAEPAISLCHQYGAKVLINAKPALLKRLPHADGLQLASTAIMALTERPIPADKILSISTHCQAEIDQALTLQTDVILLSPVQETRSHPGEPALGWKAFSEFVKSIPVPVYALGGMDTNDIKMAKKQGAQGIAAISSFWPKKLNIFDKT